MRKEKRVLAGLLSFAVFLGQISTPVVNAVAQEPVQTEQSADAASKKAAKEETGSEAVIEVVTPEIPGMQENKVTKKKAAKEETASKAKTEAQEDIIIEDIQTIPVAESEAKENDEPEQAVVESEAGETREPETAAEKQTEAVKKETEKEAETETAKKEAEEEAETETAKKEAESEAETEQKETEEIESETAESETKEQTEKTSEIGVTVEGTSETEPEANLPGQADAYLMVCWSDEEDLSNRRETLEAEEFLQVCADGEAMVIQPQIRLAESTEENPNPSVKYGMECFRYVIEDLPLTTEDGETEITYTVKEKPIDLLLAYQAVSESALTIEDTQKKTEVLEALEGPRSEGIRLVYQADKNEYRPEQINKKEKCFANYLAEYAMQGSVIWKDGGNKTGRPDMEQWFANQISITTQDQESYQSYRIHYEQDADQENQWNFTIQGLFQINKQVNRVTYQIHAAQMEGYALQIEGAEISADNAVTVITLEAEQTETAAEEETEEITETEAETISETIIEETETETQAAETETETQEAETETETQAAEPETETIAVLEAEEEPDPEIETEAKPEIQAEPETEAKSELQAEPETESETEPEAETKLAEIPAETEAEDGQEEELGEMIEAQIIETEETPAFASMTAEELQQYIEEQLAENPDWINTLTADELTELVKAGVETGVFDRLAEAWDEDDYDAFMEDIEERAEALGILEELAQIYRGEAMLLEEANKENEENKENKENEENTLDVTGRSIIKTDIPVTLDKEITLSYTVTSNDNTPYTGKYIILKDGKKQGKEQTVEDGNLTLPVKENGTYTIQLISEDSGDSDETVYKVTADDGNKNLTKACLMSALEQEGIAVEKTADYYYSEYTADPVVLTKTWNDGRIEHAEDFQKHFKEKHVKLTCKVGEKDITDTLSGLNQNGIDVNVNAAAEENKMTVTGSVYTISFEKLPKYYYDADGKKEEIQYSFEEIECTDSDCPIKMNNYIVSDHTSAGVEDATGTCKMNTLKVNTGEANLDYNATIIWKDREKATEKEDGTTEETVPDSRPSATNSDNNAFVKGITVCRLVNGIKDQTFKPSTEDLVDYITVSPSDANSSEWNISLQNLEKYDASGNEYTYYIEQTSEFASSTGGDYKYSKKYENVGAYGVKSDGLYNGGTLTDTRVETIPFTFQVEWIDGGNNWDRDCNLYLYRYAEADGTTVDTASPVQGFDHMSFENGVLKVGDQVIDQDENGVYTWSGASGAAALDKYSPNGSIYTYYIKQKDLGNADYKDSYYDENAEGTQTENSEKYIVNNGKIVNQLKTDTSPQITKTWEAKALQGKISELSVQLQLQRRYVYQSSENADPQYSTWDPVTDDDGNPVTTTQGGFSSAVMTKEVGEGAYDGYTSEDITVTLENDTDTLLTGTRIEYQWVETAVVYKVTGENGAAEEKIQIFGDNGQTTLSGLTSDNTDVVVKQTYTVVNGINTEVKNQLIDRTQVNVSKNWSGDEWPENAVVNVKLCREDGKPVVHNAVGDEEPQAVHSITLSQGNQTASFEDLPRYDEDGREIIYYVEEKEIGREIAGNNTVYHYYDTSYSKHTDPITLEDNTTLKIRQTDAEIQNTRPGTGGITINVNKRWLDDGDLTHRQNTTIGIFSKADINDGTAFDENGELKSDKAEATTILSDASAWTQKLSFTPRSNTQYWKIKDGYTIDTATQTDAAKYPVYVDDTPQKKDDLQLYWKEECVERTDTPTEYPVYIQKTTTNYSSTEQGDPVTTFENEPLYWEEGQKTTTTSPEGTEDKKVYYYTASGDGISKPVYSKANGEETTENITNGAANTPVYVKEMTQGADSDRYIALEISVGGSAVTYTKKNDSYAWITKSEILSASDNASYLNGTNASRVIGEVGTTDHLYNVYIGTTNANGMSGYTITNQRKGVLEIDVQKTWQNGNLARDEQSKAAFFKIYRKLNGASGDGEDITAQISDGIGSLITNDAEKPSEAFMCNLNDREAAKADWTIKVPNIASEENPSVTIMQAIIKQLPKYDELGRLYQYTISEYAVEDPDPDQPIRYVENGTVKVSVKQGTKQDGSADYKYDLGNANSNVQYYDQYSAAMQAPTEEPGAQNTNDVYTYQSINTRSQTFKVSLRKVWQDDGLNHADQVPFRRADIYFRMYKVPVGSKIGETVINCEDDLLSLSNDQVQQLIKNTDICSQEGGDYRWNTQHNEWYWTCDMDGEFQRYNAEGKEYLYFAVEKSNDFLDYQTVYYNGEVQPEDSVDGQTPTNTEEVFHEKDQLTDFANNTGNLLVVHKEGDGLQSNGSVLNIRKGYFDAKATKIWASLPENFDPSETPVIYMELRRRLILNEENKIYGAWETVSVKKSDGTTSFTFPTTDRYDEYGRKYEFDVQEKYYEKFNDVNVALKLTQNAETRFFKAAGENGSKAGFELVGEGCYYSNDNGSNKKLMTNTAELSSSTTFFTKKVTYSQANDGDYVKIGENEYKLFSALSDDEQKLVRNEQRYSRTEGDYIAVDADTYLGLDHVPGYKQAAQNKGDNFTWTNTYDPNAELRQRVEITVNKTWVIPAYANEIPELEFQLWRHIDGTDVEKDEKVSTITQNKTTVTKSAVEGKITIPVSVTFTKDGENNGETLAYYAPNGKPYTYYIKEVVPGGYLGKITYQNQSEKTQQGDGTDDTVLQSDNIDLKYYKVSEDHLVFYNQPAEAGEDQKDKIASYTNTYNGLPVVTNKAIKVWDDQNNKYSMRPSDIDLTLTLSGAGYQDGDKTSRVVAEYNTSANPDVNNGSWTSTTDKTSNTCNRWEYNFTNEQIRTDSALQVEQIIGNGNEGNFPKYGPNGEPFTYTVTESKAGADTDNKIGSYKQTTSVAIVERNSNDETSEPGSITSTITNTLETTSISANKKWQGTDGTNTWEYNGTVNTNGDHDDAELETLYHMGAMPTKVTFTLQYTDTAIPGDNDWEDVSPVVSQEYQLATVNGTNITWDQFDKVKKMRDGVTFNNLPKYILGNNSTSASPQERKYRIRETCEYAQNNTDAAVNDGQFSFDSVTTATAANGGTTTVTNQVTLKKITLVKEWDDQENFLNTRPDDIKFVVTNTNGSETYELTKANNSIANNQDQWSKEIWTPAVTITVTEPYDSQSDATKSMLKDENEKNTYNVNSNEPIITTSTDGQTITVKNVLDENLKKRTQITVSKTWVDDEYTSLYRVIHPTEIEYKLQYSYLKNGTWTDWADADDKCGIISSSGTQNTSKEEQTSDNSGVSSIEEPNNSDDGSGSTGLDTSSSVSETTNTKKSEYVETPTNGEKNWPDVTWKELYQYYNDPNTDVALPIRYQVVETAVNGYTTTYSAPVTAKDAAKVEDTLYDTKGTLTVTNKVDDSACASLKKAWGTTMENNIAIATALSKTVTGKKDGETTLAAIGSAEDVKTLQSKGLLPMGIKFQLQYTTKTDNSDWTDYSGKVYTADTAAKIYDLLSKDVTVYNKLPKTDTNGNAIQYRFVEAFVNFKDTDENNYISVVSSATSSTTIATTENTTLYTVDTGLTSSNDADKKTVAYASVITNKIPTGKITVTKSVMDEGNRDNTRGDITVELQRNVNGNYSTYATGTLTYDKTTKKWNPITFDVPIYDTKTFTNKTGASNEWQIVEKTVNGTNLNGYTATLTYTSGSSVELKDTTDKTTDTVNIDNTRVPARFSLTAEKNWADDDNNSMGTRPENSEVNFTLQYSTDKGQTWNPVIESASGTSAPNANTSTDKEAYYYQVNTDDSHSGYYYTKSGGSWTTENGTEAYTTSSPTQTVNGLSDSTAKKAKWENLCVNSTGNPIYYRVIENTDAAVTGYKVVTANDITITNGTLQTVEGKVGVFTATANAEADVKITNHLDTTSLKVTKTWAGDDTYKAQMRPDLITYKVEYRVDKEGSDWSPVPAKMLQLITADQGKASIAEQKDSKDTGEFTMNVDKTNASQSITLEGLPIKDNAGNQYFYRVSEVSMTYKGTTADTDKTVALNNGSTWTSSNTKSDFVSKTNEVSSTTIGAYTVTQGETDWTAGTGGAAGTWKAEITNTLETVEVTASKNWDDEANRDNLRDAVTFHLNPQTKSGETYTESTDFTVAGETTGQTIALNAASLAVTWKNLPRYQKLAENHSESALYYYKVSEDDTIKDSSNNSIYSIAVSPEQVAYAAGDNGDRLAVGVTNSYTPERFTATAKKTWNDYNDAMNTRPAEVSLTLQYKVGESGAWADVVKATTEATMPTTVGSDPIYCGGKYYKVESGKYVPDGTTAYTTREVTQKVKGNSTDHSLSDTATWNDLSVNSDGTQITYRVVENETSANGNSVKVTGYLDPVIVGTTNADGTTSDTFKGKNNTQTDVTVTNNIDTVPLNLKKTWAGDKSDHGDFRSMRPDSLIYQVEYALKPTDGSTTVTWKNLPDSILAKAADAINVKVLTATAGSTDTGRFEVKIDKTSEKDDAKDEVSLTGLPYQNSEGTQYIYRVSEIAAVFKADSSGDTDTSSDTDTSGDIDTSGDTETTIQADLAKDNGSVTWASLDDTKSQLDIGDSHTYTIGGYKITVAETSYAAVQSGQTGNGSWNAAFTNTLETVSLEATKNWLDNNNRDNTRVDLKFDVTVKLGDETCTQFTVPSKELKTTANTYTVTWTGLPKYDRTTAKWTDNDVKQYSYEVKESNTSAATDAQKEMLKKYTSSGGTATYDTKNNKWTTEITNTLGSIDVFEIEASKVWDDAFTADTGSDINPNHNVWCNAEEKQRPDRVTFKLQYMIKAANGSISWTDVESSADKSSETDFPSAKGESDPEVIFWGGRYFKWEADSADSADSTKENSGKYVEADGVYTTSSIEQTINKVNDSNQWSSSPGSKWENLPVSAKGEVISYRVVETSKNVPTYYFSKREHEEIKGTDTTLVTENDGKKTVSTKITNKLTKLKLFKTDGTKLSNGNLNPLEGVEFQIQLKNSSGNATGTAYKATTNSSGEVEFVGLAPGTYIVTELKTTQGHQLLAEPFEVTLPMNMTVSDITTWDNAHEKDADKISKENAVLSDNGTSWNFYQLTYTVTNSANLDVPMTGNAGTWYPGFLAFLPIAAAYVLYRRRKKYNRA